MKNSEHHITDNIKQQRFEMPVGDQLAFIVYRWEHGKLALMHTEVPEEAEGKGIASSLAKFVFEKAKQDQRKILVYCPFISTYLKRHPEYKELVEKDYNI
jgi:predicted GNAT family acetyltransferase